MWAECHANAVIKIRHTGLALCKAHFLKNVEDRVGKALVRHHMLGTQARPRRELWVVAMSGGKDSQALAEVLRKRFPAAESEDSPVTLVGLYIDVHVSGRGYTDESRAVVERTCARLQMPCHVVDVRERYGVTMDDLHVVAQCRRGAHRTECSACGIMKRYLINRAAAELGADKVATGHHLTDEATNVLANFLAMNVEQMSRPQPWERRTVVSPAPISAERLAETGTGLGTGDVGVLVPRVKPFIEVTEEETAMYVFYAGIEHVATQCPYSAGASSSALKKHVLAIEKERPGTMLLLVRGFNKVLLPILRGNKATAAGSGGSESLADPEEEEPVAATAAAAAAEQQQAPEAAAAEEAAAGASGDVQLNACSNCGCPTIVPVCAWCKLLEQVKQFRVERPELFEAGGARCHHCDICCPAAEGGVPGVADVEEVSLTSDFKAKSKKRMRREAQRERRHVAQPQQAPAPAQPMETTPTEPAPAEEPSK